MRQANPRSYDDSPNREYPEYNEDRRTIMPTKIDGGFPSFRPGIQIIVNSMSEIEESSLVMIFEIIFLRGERTFF